MPRPPEWQADWLAIKARFLANEPASVIAKSYSDDPDEIKRIAKSIQNKASSEGWHAQRTEIVDNMKELVQTNMEEVARLALEVSKKALGSYLAGIHEKKDVPVITKSLDKAWPKDGAMGDDEPPGFIINAPDNPPP